MRELGNQWVEHYPIEHRLDLLGRLQSNRLGDFHPAFWELYLHEYFLKLGFQVEVHPQVSGTTKRPDFLVSSSESRFYVEAVTVTGGSPQSQSSTEGQIYDAINEKVNHPRFCLAIRDVTAGPKSPRKKMIYQPIQRWLDSLDADAFAPYGKENFKHEDLLVKTLAVDDWIISVEAISLPVGRKSEFGYREILVYPAIVGFASDHIHIRKRLEEKSAKYGELETPFVLALQSMLIGSVYDDEQLLRALFGDTTSGAECLATGTLDRTYCKAFASVLVSLDGPRNRHISAVLFNGIIHPASVNKSNLTWVANPWAKHPITCPVPARQLRRRFISSSNCYDW